MIDEDGYIIWKGEFDDWGKLVWEKGETTCRLRLLGQIADLETGLYYNRFRYYLPEIGQFISPDPIGMAGGTNRFRYAPNAIGWVDALGLVCKKGHRPRNAQQELREITLSGRSTASIESELRQRGFKPCSARSGGTVWTKPMPKGQTAAVRIDPAMQRTPPKGFADEVPHAHKESVSTSAVNKRGNYDPTRAITLDDSAQKTTDPLRTHIPIL